MKKKISALLFLIPCFSLAACSGSNATPQGGESYNIVRPDFTPEYETYALSSAPSGINVTYYSDIYSRGFSWLTNNDAPETELALVKSDKGAEADFSNPLIFDQSGTHFEYFTCEKDGTFTTINNELPSHKGSSNDYELTGFYHRAYVEGLDKNTAYSYRIGSRDGGYAYGAFITNDVNSDPNHPITVISMSDAQTKDPDKLNVWRNTFVHAVETAGPDLDFALNNGDQFDQNITRVHSSDQYKPNRLLCYAKALDVISDYKFNIPYMTSSGNHEPTAPYSHYLMNNVNFAGYDYSGGYYSFDYEWAHFVVLNTSLKVVDDEQMTWLKNDLSNCNAKWKIVMMHVSPHSTGDNSNKTDIQKLVERVTPVFSEYHVDLVLQAHDHTYSKTKPYLWDAAGYTTTWNNDQVVNLNPQTNFYDEAEYDFNPNGTYYVTTGAAGHRCGAAESDGIWAEVVQDGDSWKGLDSSKTFLDNKYKIELGKLQYDNEYEPYTFSGHTSDQHYETGDLATGNVNAQMFGVLKIKEDTLRYDVYTVNGDQVKLFDTLGVEKVG